MNRYLVFVGSDYYPRGGIKDFVGDFPSKEQAIEVAVFTATQEGTYPYAWAHIYDLVKNKIIQEFDYDKDHSKGWILND